MHIFNRKSWSTIEMREAEIERARFLRGALCLFDSLWSPIAEYHCKKVQLLKIQGAVDHTPCTQKPPDLFCSLLIQRLFTFDTAFYDADNSYTLLRIVLPINLMFRHPQPKLNWLSR